MKAKNVLSHRTFAISIIAVLDILMYNMLTFEHGLTHPLFIFNFLIWAIFVIQVIVGVVFLFIYLLYALFYSHKKSFKDYLRGY